MRFSRGATLLDTIVGVTLMLTVFLGITAAFQLSVDMVTNNKARTGAAALAQEQLEYIRSLSYDATGTTGGIPAGAIPQVEQITLNGVAYTRRVLVKYLDDPKDGLGAADENNIITDSKEIKVEVSWDAPGGLRYVTLVSRASPSGIEQLVPGGTISITVVNATAQPVVDAAVRIENASTSPAIDVTSYTNSAGGVSFSGVPQASGYRITASKSGYSTAQTYTATVQNPNPNPGNLTVSLNQTTALTLAIDTLGQGYVRTFKQIELATWSDLFNDISKIGETSSTTVSGGNTHLVWGDATYDTPGFVRSINIAPTYVSRWREFSWVDTRPAQTAVTYHVYFPGASGPELIPDSVLPGNSTGFSTSPVNVSGIATTTYPSLQLYAALTTADPGETPTIEVWSLTYDSGPEPLPNISFSMRGAKTIGTDGSGAPIYKYNQTLSSGALSLLHFPTLEWDSYTTTVQGATIGYDIAESCTPQPRTLSPGGTIDTRLYFSPHTTHSLLVDVRNTAGDVLETASVRLYRGLYDTTQLTGGCGQVFFSNLSSGTVGGGNPYSIQVSAPGYQTYTAADTEVSGASRLTIVLNPS